MAEERDDRLPILIDNNREVEYRIQGISEANFSIQCPGQFLRCFEATQKIDVYLPDGYRSTNRSLKIPTAYSGIVLPGENEKLSCLRYFAYEFYELIH